MKKLLENKLVQGALLCVALVILCGAESAITSLLDTLYGL